MRCCWRGRSGILLCDSVALVLRLESREEGESEDKRHDQHGSCDGKDEASPDILEYVGRVKRTCGQQPQIGVANKLVIRQKAILRRQVTDPQLWLMNLRH